MARKVLISFLGAIAYENTIYEYGGKESKPTPYVQKALFELMLTNWQAQDKVLIFTTQDAFSKNWKGRALSPEKVEADSGLEHHFLELRQQRGDFHFEHKLITNGSNEAEIWQIFETIFNALRQLQQQETEELIEVYFDITFGFRTLPMLGLLLGHYAQTIGGFRVARVFYGNFEDGRNKRESDIKALGLANDEQKRYRSEHLVKAPIIDLTGFIKLQNWISAVQLFQKAGDAQALIVLLNDNKSDTNIQQFAELLGKFTQAIHSCRGAELNQHIAVDLLKTNIKKLEASTDTKQLAPLLEKIDKKITPFHSQSTLNGFAAVDWCIEHSLIQQGYTFLLETIISYVAEKAYQQSFVGQYKIRTAINNAINIPTLKNIQKQQYLPNNSANKLLQTIQSFSIEYTQTSDIAKEFSIPQKKDITLSDLYKKLVNDNGLRNDINHCGYNAHSTTAEDLKRKLILLNRGIKKIFQL
jgi:hypothetical protein